jgi:hypothetical protein
MAQIFADDFEDGTHDAWEEVGTNTHTIVDAPTYGLTGTYALEFTPWGYVRKTITQISELYISFLARFGNTGYLEDVCAFFDSNGTQILSITRTGACLLEARLGNFGGTVLETGSTALNIYSQTPSHYQLEIRLKPRDSGGVVQIKIDGSASLEIDYSGDTTAGLENICKVQLGGNPDYAHLTIDDVVFDDAAWVSGPGGVPEATETMTGGIIFGGSMRGSVSSPMSVAVKSGTFRINDVTYTLPGVLSIVGISGQIAALVTCNTPPTSGLYRYDIAYVGVDSIVQYLAGTATAIPVMPTTPADHVLIDWILLHSGMSRVSRSDIHRLYRTPSLNRIVVSLSDDELSWIELTSTITVAVYDQYSQLLPGNWIVSITIDTGNGSLSSDLITMSNSSSGSVIYTRGGNDPGDVSPRITVSLISSGYLRLSKSIFIRLLNLDGDVML